MVWSRPIALADAGWDVLLLETNDAVGGAVSSAEVTAPGFSSDMFSAFYPLAAASPVIKGLDLADHGLTWVQADKVLAHALPDGQSAVLERDPERTAAGLEEFGPGDGQAWLDMFDGWQQIRDPLLDAMFTPLPPIRSALKLLRRAKLAGVLDLARLAVLPVRRLGDGEFAGDGGPLLLTGNAMHADVPPDAAGSGVFGWLLAMLGQDVGFPVPQGGAHNLALALQRRFQSLGRCGPDQRESANNPGVRRPCGRRANVRRQCDLGGQGGRRRRRGADSVSRSGWAAASTGRLLGQPRALSVGQPDREDQLGVGPAAGLAVTGCGRRRHRAFRRRP